MPALLGKKFHLLGIFGFASILFLAGISNAQDPAGSEPRLHAYAEPGRLEKVELDKEYLKGYFTDLGSLLTSPLRWDGEDWLKASLVAGITIGLYIYDEKIRDLAQRNRSSISDEVSRWVRGFGPVGNELIAVPVLGTFYLYGYVARNDKAKSAALLSLESFFITSFFTHAIKFSTHRHRPSEGPEHDRWDGPRFSTTKDSFPSWQSSAAWSVATVLANAYADHVWVPPLAYTIATLTSFSRVNDNDHWASDVFFGAALGYFTAKGILSLHREKNIAVTPILDGPVTGVALSYVF